MDTGRAFGRAGDELLSCLPAKEPVKEPASELDVSLAFCLDDEEDVNSLIV